MDSPADDKPITALLGRWNAGDPQALHEVTALVYRQLSELARNRRRAPGREQTLETAGLVHEVFLRLVQTPTRVHDRQHFFRLASRIMRNVLVDHARAAQAAKRGAGLVVTLHDDAEAIPTTGPDIERLSAAIEDLTQRDPVKAQMIDLVYFGGFSGPEAAEILGLAVSTFYRELSFARAWLKSELTSE